MSTSRSLHLFHFLRSKTNFCKHSKLKNKNTSMCSSSTQTAVTIPAHPACRKTVRGKKNINHTENKSHNDNPVAQQLWIGGTKLEKKKRKKKWLTVSKSK